MELIDVLDEKGNKTGKTKPKSEVHRDGDWHYGVHVFFVNSKNEVLMQRRAKDKENYPDMWDFSAAGHVSSGENSINTAVREIKEEIGVDISIKELKLIGRVVQSVVINNGTYFDNEIDDVFLVKNDFSTSEFRMSDGEVQYVKWVPLEEIKRWVKDKNPELVPHEEDYQILFQELLK